MATRDFSKKQEKVISDFLFEGGGLTPNSGAGFKKADLQTSRFIVEAKTHTTKTNKHSVLIADVSKLWKYAEGALKVPLYIFDFGSQKLADQWVLMPLTNARVFTTAIDDVEKTPLDVDSTKKSFLVHKPSGYRLFFFNLNGVACVIFPLNMWKGVY